MKINGNVMMTFAEAPKAVIIAFCGTVISKYLRISHKNKPDNVNVVQSARM